MTDEQAFIKDIHQILKSSLEVEDWVSIKELIHEISDYLYQEGHEEYEDDLLDS
jgi:hypothetical protein